MLLRRGFALAAGSRSGWAGVARRFAFAGRLRVAGRRAAEPPALLLELHAQAGKLTLDLPDRLLPLVEPLAFGLRERELLRGFLLALLGLGDLAGELA